MQHSLPLFKSANISDKHFILGVLKLNFLLVISLTAVENVDQIY